MNKPYLANPEEIYKILIIGDQKVGKSSILLQYSEGIFDVHIPQTNGIDFRPKEITIENKKLKLKIWDTAGQERYHGITLNFYKGAHGVILVFDLTDATSLNSIPEWIRRTKNYCAEQVPKILLGNKCDLEIKIEKSKILEVCKEHNLEYFETSAKLNKNINESFFAITKLVLNNVTNLNNINEIGKEKKKFRIDGKPREDDDFSDISQCKC